DEEGLHHLTLFIENGRIVDRGAWRLKSALAAIAGLDGLIDRGAIVMTPNQNIIIARANDVERQKIERILAEHGVKQGVSVLREGAMACVALPTCGLALAESERYLPGLLTKIEGLLADNGLSDQHITLRMTGCPNGCARPYLAEIGLVGTGPGAYNLYLGGAFDGTRLSKLHRKQIGHDEIVATLRPLFASYARERTPGEPFSDYMIRAGIVAATTAGNRFHADLAPDLEP
ncbi:MAG: sulfite reductase, partial [Acetobacteraceae bacterium]